MLVSFSGLPAAGKTTIAREVASRVGAFHLEVDLIERGISEANGEMFGGRYAEAYAAAYVMVANHLSAGRAVVVDSVNLLSESRDQWVSIARSASVAITEIEVICSDPVVHHARLPAGPTAQWQRLARHYEPWARHRLVVDTATTPLADCVASVLAGVRGQGGLPS